MKSESISPLLLKRIDAWLLLSYPHLKADDEAYYLGEFTPRELAAFSEMNRLIINYKKRNDRKNYCDWPYKEQAIKNAAALFQTSIHQTTGMTARMQHALLVPVPPSEAKNSSNYDERNSKLLDYFSPSGNICELILQKESRPSLRASKLRDPKKLEENYFLSTISLDKTIREIWLFDDVLTKGTTFRAASDFLKKSFPVLKIVGFFIARSVYPS